MGEREIKDPTVKECELQSNSLLDFQRRNPNFSESRLFRAFSKDYQYVEYPKDSLKMTTSTPKIEWGMNKKSCMNVFYRYREDFPEIRKVIKKLEKTKYIKRKLKKSKLANHRHWHSVSKDFVKKQNKKKSQKMREKLKAEK